MIGQIYALKIAIRIQHVHCRCEYVFIKGRRQTFQNLFERLLQRWFWFQDAYEEDGVKRKRGVAESCALIGCATRTGDVRHKQFMRWRPL